ncbi:adenylate cyclase [Kaistia sp. 32K]|uniref:hypothetical protein n=1 Tax=Kaistia sp. 32K TaxID=2795690 RepID=UPI001916BD38|nr:hypothetical protein [Kaistia sp. 32K]BCP52490.1 adenylate cyclase [Kaistia sp. 32K]
MNYMPDADRPSTEIDSAFPPAEVRAALRKALASPELVASPQLCAFLTYVVEARLAGNEHLLKGQNIGRVVLGRPESFDAQRDPIVRVEANRLRRTLTAYYKGSGADETMHLVVGRGSYVPRFEPAPPPPAVDAPEPPAAAPQDRPAPAKAHPLPVRAGRLALIIGVALASIAVAVYGAITLFAPQPVARTPVVNATHVFGPGVGPGADQPYLPSVEVMAFTTHTAGSAAERARELVATLTVSLARFPELRVLARGSERADFRLDGEVTLGETTNTVAMRLSVAGTAEVIWSASVELKPNELGSDSGIERVVAIATTAIAPQFGAIAQYLAGGKDVGEADEGGIGDYGCMISAQLQHHRLDDGSWQKLDACLRDTIARYPNFATAAASRALLLVEDYRLDPVESSAQVALRDAETEARRALQLEPTNVRALTAAAVVALGKDDLDVARTIGLRAVTANPLDPLSRSQYVLTLIASGYYDQALAQSAIARQIDPAHISFYDSLDYLAHFGKGTEPNPLRSAVVADVPTLPYGAIARVLAYNSGDENEARDQARAVLYEIMPAFADDMPSALHRQFTASPFTERLEAALRQAEVGS